MGKKTDAQLKTLSEKGDACAQTANNLLHVLQAWPVVDKEWSKWEPEMIKLSNWEDHPYAKKRAAIWQKGKDLSAKLKNEIHVLNMAMADFKGYVTKKEKSKNPFKSKNSLPSSKETIKLYDKVLQDLNELAQNGGSVFR
jgi:hypothetical protein